MGHPGAYMGWWGSMGSPKQKRITIHSVSPYAQSPLHGSVNRAIFNSFRRFKSQVLYIALPFAIVWSVWTEARDYNEYLYTKAGREELERLITSMQMLSIFIFIYYWYDMDLSAQ
ncbi:hypothetical protein CAS74_003086 [Pichia kudriavzevii]|uniref:Cytochrome b-c1 complex subunit 8 n=1 Tax=Pichia kudriavzevii TaxID=4909 RepID=A0A1Z8JND2_PICKU|nr:hypothetical protein CAS74_003086 [Pichia kudriavzevii]